MCLSIWRYCIRTLCGCRLGYRIVFLKKEVNDGVTNMTTLQETIDTQAKMLSEKSSTICQLVYTNCIRCDEM